MVQLEAKKAHVLSVRLLSKNFVNTTPEGRQLRTRLKELDQRWEALTASAARTQQALQGALLKCEEFHHTVHDYLVWMERMEERLQRCEPVRLSPDHSVLWSKYMTLKVSLLYHRCYNQCSFHHNKIVKKYFIHRICKLLTKYQRPVVVCGYGISIDPCRKVKAVWKELN